MRRLGFKQPAEIRTEIVDFRASSKILASGEWITWITTNTTVVKRHADIFTGDKVLIDDANGIVSSALPSDGSAKLILGAGRSRQDYEIEVLGSTNLGNVINEELVLPVQEF